MYSKINNSRIFAVALLVAALASGCVKKRDDLNVQGSNLSDLIAVEGSETKSAATVDPRKLPPLNTWKHTITFNGKLENSGFSISENTEVETSEVGILFHDIAKYETTDPLLKGKEEVLRILAPTDRQVTYELKYELNPFYLVVYKVVPTADLSHYEKPYSKQVGAENWWVPIASFAVNGFSNIEKVRNEDNRDTNLVGGFEIPRIEYKRAKFFSIDKENVQAITRIEKKDVFPREFFSTNTREDWFFHETIVDTNYSSNEHVGGVWGVHDVTFTPATRVRFILKDNFLFAVNANIAEEFQNNDNNLEDVATVRIAATPFRSRLSQLGMNDSRPEEISVQDELPNYDQITLNLPTLRTAQSEYEGRLATLFNSLGLSGFNTERSVKMVRVGKGFLQIVIEDNENRTLRSFAFRKADADNNSPYEPKQFFRTDARTFGFYDAQRAQKRDYKVYLQEDVDSYNFITRFNPKKDIVYHFSKQTPKTEWYRDIGRETINMWQQAFEKAGLKIKIRLDESKDVDLGDIRYNIINITPKRGGNGGTVGFGPFTVDTKTGEIISANLNVYVESMLNGTFAQFRQYVEIQSGIRLNFKEQSKETILPSSLQKILTTLNGQRVTVDPNGHLIPIPYQNPERLLTEAGRADVVAEFKQLFDEHKFNRLYFNTLDVSTDSLTSLLTEMPKAQTESPELAIGWNPDVEEATLSSAPTEALKRIVDSNPECKGVNDLIAIAKKNGSFTTEESLRYLNPCVMAWGALNILSTAVHEVGHNLGLRHNFMGSYDRANFIPMEEFKLKYLKGLKHAITSKTSAIMDYVPDEDLHVAPGSYEIAAIKWAYDSTVVLKNGQSVKIPNELAIVDVVSDDQIKPYLYCTDGQRISRNDYRCQAHEQGTTPTEVVSYLIEDFYERITSIYRFNRISLGSPEGYAMGSEFFPGTFIKLRSFYNSWRRLVTQKVGLNNRYLENYMSTEDYDKNVIQPIISSSPEAKELFLARNMIAQFFLEMSLMNNKYCVGKDKTYNTSKIVELEKIRTELKSLGYDGSVSKCSDSVVLEQLAARNIEFEREVGYFFESGKFLVDPNDDLDRIDFIGIGGLRASALEVLLLKQIDSENNAEDGFLPSFLDEPDLRNFVFKVIEDRAINGVRLRTNDLTLSSLVKDTAFTDKDIEDYLNQRGRPYFMFGKESNLLIQMIAQARYGAMIPERLEESSERLADFNSDITSDQRILEQKGSSPLTSLETPDGRAFFFVPADGSKGRVTVTAMNKIRENKAITRAKGLDVEKLVTDFNQIKGVMQPFLINDKGEWSLGQMYGLHKAISELLGNNPNLELLMVPLLSHEFSIVNTLINGNSEQSQAFVGLIQAVESPEVPSETKFKAKLELAKKIPAKGFYSADKTAKETPRELTLAELDRRFSMIKEDLTQKKVAFDLNREEIDAQTNLLYQLLYFGTN